MAFLGLFKKKEEVPPEGAPFQQAPPGEIPVDQVLSLQQQGLSNNQIIQTLQRQGYSPQQIYDGLAQAEAQAAVGPAEEFPPPEGLPPLPGEAPAMQMTGRVAQGTEEMVESIVEEKWRELQGQLGKISEWRDHTDSRLDKLEQSIQDLKADIDNLHKAIVSKIGEYDKNLLDVGTEIKAMEKVFQKVLPELTGSVSELSRITRTIKPAARK